ncbi:hypothetical protein DOFOFD_00775 [Acetobacteraceae bacterium EV16P]|uniref:Molecular chaperone DjlA n=1 Tax=Sorlinia euscelidii TaxID=3081148 RepID=A0ABU7U119_9PROT
MGIWGKMFGGIAGFAVGGPIGALMGLGLGHAADNGRLLEGPAGVGVTDGAARARRTRTAPRFSVRQKWPRFWERQTSFLPLASSS